APGPTVGGGETPAPGAVVEGQGAPLAGATLEAQNALAPEAAGAGPGAPEMPAGEASPTLDPTPLAEAFVPASPSTPSTVPLSLPALERAWRDPAPDLATRADRVRSVADALGITDVEPIARAALLAGTGSALERARAAGRVAPGRPAAQAALAAAEWRQGDLAAAALAAARALAALPRRLEGRLWLEAAAATLLFAAALGAGGLWIAARGARAAAAAAHDAADRIDPSLPGFARAALVAAGVLAPAALGEGPIGAVLGLFALA